MHIIKLDATDSTNLYLKNLTLSEPLEDLTVVVTKEQRKGRGQVGTTWQSESGKNLTFSILKKFDGFFVKNQFHLNIVVSLAVHETLKTFEAPNLKIKWPNDILSGTDKLCGILIENTLQGQKIMASIIGIGINVNQTDFPNLFNATSLKLLLGKKFNLEELLQGLLQSLQHYFELLDSGNIEELEKSYLEALFMKEEIGEFQRADEQLFSGTIKGISEIGKLQVLLGNGIVEEFSEKDVKFLL